MTQWSCYAGVLVIRAAICGLKCKAIPSASGLLPTVNAPQTRPFATVSTTHLPPPCGPTRISCAMNYINITGNQLPKAPAINNCLQGVKWQYLHYAHAANKAVNRLVVGIGIEILAVRFAGPTQQIEKN